MLSKIKTRTFPNWSNTLDTLERNACIHARACTRAGKGQIHSWMFVKREQNRIPGGKITEHRKAKQQERPVLLDREHARTQRGGDTIRKRNWDSNGTSSNVCRNANLLPRTVLAFPFLSSSSSLPPPFSSHSLDLPARALHPRHNG